MKKVVLITMLAASLLSTQGVASSYDEYAIKPAEQQLSNQQQKVDEPISFLPIPTFITEPAVGPGLGVVGLFFHDNEKKAKKKKKDGSTLPQSISLVGLMGTKNGTKGGAVGHITFWDEDRIRYQGIVGWASINLDFYTFDEIQLLTPLSLNIEGPAVFQNLKLRYDDSNFFYGFKQIYRKVEISLAENPIEDFLLENDIIKDHLSLDVNTSGIGPLIEYDSRDNPLNPERGFNYKAEYLYYDEAIGSKVDYTSLKLTALNYWRYTDKFNFALRMQYDSVNNRGDKRLPVYIPPSISLRGVSATRYQGLDVFVTEAEASYKITHKIKLNMFTGMGWAADNFSDLSKAETIDTVGAGFRYLIDEHYGISIGLDVAHGPEQNAIYIQAGSTW
ncbi:BamA/TamA family outer membrane protein [Pseudoalteromonas gelatinilytica]|uniref:Glyceraldehyde-3-phosphate dehydrogenase n=2 Tax=Pseudoalteromonas TaxID=53246 RepID=A0ABQ1TLF0_9GAMM|nr:BamA/TamA family outer membrane protein [Pseudoalteromonas profundi]GGE96751.1 glyceraldehyde-3-phosphate dehydrogenase [Pseudoalteromonas profundi]